MQQIWSRRVTVCVGNEDAAVYCKILFSTSSALSVKWIVDSVLQSYAGFELFVLGIISSIFV